MGNQSGGIFSFLDSFSINQDLKMFHRATRAGWLSEDKRNELQEKAFELAMRAASEDDPDNFTKLVKIVEMMFQFDRKRDLDNLTELVAQLQAARRVGAPLPQMPEITDGNMEEIRAALLERIRRLPSVARN